MVVASLSRLAGQRPHRWRHPIFCPSGPLRQLSSSSVHGVRRTCAYRSDQSLLCGGRRSLRGGRSPSRLRARPRPSLPAGRPLRRRIVEIRSSAWRGGLLDPPKDRAIHARDRFSSSCNLHPRTQCSCSSKTPSWQDRRHGLPCRCLPNTIIPNSKACPISVCLMTLAVNATTGLAPVEQ